jgi:hypothetical protein
VAHDAAAHRETGDGNGRLEVGDDPPPSPLVGRKVGEAAWANEGVFMEKWSSLTSCTGPN